MICNNLLYDYVDINDDDDDDDDDHRHHIVM